METRTLLRLARAAGCAALLLAAAGAPAAGQTASPEVRAKSIAVRWKPLLGLTDEQTVQFEKIALDAEKRTAQARVAAGGDPARLREAMAPILKDRNAAVAKLLTPEQMKKYEAAMDLARKRAAETPAAPRPTSPPG